MTLGYSLSPNIQLPNSGISSSNRLAHNASWEPNTINDTELLTDERSSGPRTERLIAALLPMKADKAPDSKAEDGPSTKPQKPPLLGTLDLEERVKGELQSVGVALDDEVCFVRRRFIVTV